ncbi:MAG: Ig-like domain-containing protein [Dehalococcoidales bacterium]
MKRKQIRFIFYLALGLIVILSLTMTACSSRPTSASKQPITLSSIAVTPASSNLVVNSTLQFTATGKYSDGSMADITSKVTWNTSDSSIAYLSPSGLATGEWPGQCTISASLSGITSSPAVTLNVEP